MMKRVGFCGFKPLDMKMPFCLGFGGVDTNGGCSDCDNSNEDLEFTTENCMRHESFTKSSNKSNILNTLRRKWYRTKRFKCRKKGESLINMCHSYSENCEPLHCVCAKHHRLKAHKGKSLIGPPTQLFECQVCSEYKFVMPDTSSPNAPIVDGHKGHSKSSCLHLSYRKSCGKALARVVKLKGRTSHSLSDLSCSADISSPMSKTDSENNICQINHNSEDVSATTYSNKLCLVSVENVNSNNNEEEASNNLKQKFGNLTQELYRLSKYGWYWGPISKSEAESKLIDQPDGAFLVRDSSDDRYILSLSFRSKGKTLHTRIEHSNGVFSFYSQPEPEGNGSSSIVELIKQSMCYSQSGVFCYSRSHSPGSQSFPVRLTKPISRFTHVRSLQYLCRFIIRQYIRFDHIQELPLPSRIKGYLEEGHY